MEYTSTTEHLSVARELVEIVRLGTNASYACSRQTIDAVLRLLAENVTCDGDEMRTLLRHVGGADLLDVENCSDTIRLSSAFDALSAAVADQQQRGWNLHDDQEGIMQNLSVARSVITLSEPAVPLHVLETSDYAQCAMLVSFFELEQRTHLRHAVVRTLDVLCRFDVSVVRALLPSMLPVDLVNYLDATQFVENDFTRSVLSTLTALLSTTDGLPFAHYDVLNSTFAGTLLAQTSAQSWCARECGVLLVAMSLQYADASENAVVALMCAQSADCQHFVEQIMQLANRDEDAVWPYASPPPHTSSICHHLLAMFKACEDIRTLIYANDAPVLLSLLIRRCADLSEGAARHTYMTVLVAMVTAMPDVRDDSELVRFVDAHEDDEAPGMHELRRLLGIVR